MKKVLILMSTYNGEKWLKEQNDSILDSRDVNVDILVRDDGSSDATSNGCCMVFNESLLMFLKKTPAGKIDMHDSWTNCICIAYGGKAIIDARELVSYRIHASNALGNKDTVKKICRLIHPKCLRSQTAKLVLECDGIAKHEQLIRLYSQPKSLKHRILLLKRKKPNAITLGEFVKFKIQIVLGKY